MAPFPSSTAAGSGRFLAALLLLAWLPGACQAGGGAPDSRSGPPATGEETARRRPRPPQDPTVHPGPPGTPGPSAEDPRWDHERLWSPDFSDWEPAVAADPAGPWVYQATTRFGSGQPRIAFRRSADEGRTWEADRELSPAFGAQADPLLEVARDSGQVYAVLMQVWEIQVLRSDDHGQSFGAPVPVLSSGSPPAWSDKPALAVSPDGRDVYVAFNAADAFVSVSHDFAQSFAPPVRTSSNPRYWFHSGGAVGPLGEVYFAAADYAYDYSGPVNLWVVRSLDGGQTWSNLPVDVSQEYPPCPGAGCPGWYLGPSMSLAVDAQGVLLVLYHAGDVPGGPQRMYVRTSADGGLTWTPRLEVGAGPGVNHAFPGAAAGPDPGDFRIVWMDERNGPGRWNVWYRRSTDGGLSWSEPVRLSDQPGGAAYKGPAGFAFPYGDYLEIGVGRGGRNHVVWGAGMGYSSFGGTWFTRGF